MTTVAPHRLCPRCKTPRPEYELACAGNDGNCGWDLSGVDITHGHDAPAAPRTISPVGLACPNGHPVSPGDLLCPQCEVEIPDVSAAPAASPGGATLTASMAEATAPARSVAGWQLLREVGTAGTARQRFAVRRESDGRAAVMTIYSPGAQPDAAVYDALRQRLSREHVAELIEHGRTEDQVYDVTEQIEGGSLAELRLIPNDGATIQRIVEELSTALAAFMEVGLRHRALHPEKVLVRSLEPLDLVVTGFESSRLSEADLEIESLLDVSRYTAPEAVMGAVTAASDWWGLGMMLLGLITSGRCFEGANDQLFLIHVQANGAPIPVGLDPRLDLLLRGLLAVDRTVRWQWREVRDWLAGGTPPAPMQRAGGEGRTEGPSLTLGGVVVRDPRRFAIEAARAANWPEACDLLSRGRIGLWAEELKLDGRVVANLRQLGKRIEPAVGFRLGIALQLLNPQLPLIHEGEIVNPDWLLRNPQLGHELISSSVPELLPQLGIESDSWLQRLAKRAASVRDRAKEAEIELDAARCEVLVLSASHPRLSAEWEQRRKAFPDASHPNLASLMERGRHNDEDLILLLSASLGQFRSREELIAETLELVAQHDLPELSAEFAGEWLDRSRRELFAAIDERISGFARCGNDRIDVWADRFRLERRLSLSEAIVLIAFPEGRWQKPKHQEYVASVLEFFEKRVSSASRRGPLVKMTIGKTTPRVDLFELATDPAGAMALLSSLLERSGRQLSLDPLVFADENGPEGRLRSLLNKTTQYRRDTGINGTYLGFPFLWLPADGKTRPRLAPVLLWPVNLEGEIGRRGQFKLGFDIERGGVRVNPAFEGLYGVDGTAQWRALADEMLSRSSLSPGDAVDALGAMVAPLGRTLMRLPKSDAAGTPTQDSILCCAVLFHLQFLGQSLVEDLRQLKQRPLAQTALETMLRIDDERDVAGARSASEEERIEDEARDGNEPVLVTRSDPSQEEAIAKVSRGTGLVVQGPPGTGKSQTIVNLVADSIARGRSVLIVCQKKPALDVVRKRLVAEQLGGRIVMVTNVTSDRTPFLTELRAQLEAIDQADPGWGLRREREAVQIRDRIRQLESEIDSRHEACYVVDPLCGRSYRQIVGDLIRLEGESIRSLADVVGLRRHFRDSSFQDVRSCEEACGALAGDWIAAAFEGNPLEATQPRPHDSATAAEFQHLLASFSDAEGKREQLPAPARSSSSHDCPADLDRWLSQYRPLLESQDDRELGLCAPFVQLFRQNGSGTDIDQIFQQLLRVERSRSRPAVVPRELPQWIGRFDADQVATIAEICERNTDLWWSARAEGNPLAQLPATLSSDECESFRAAFSHLVAVEADRAAAVAVDAVEVRQPEQLERWLAECEETVLEAVAAAGDAIARLWSLPNVAERCTRYEAALRQLWECLSDPPEIRVSLAPLSELLSPCAADRVDRIADECSLSAADWLANASDSWLLDAIAVVPRSQPECARLQSLVGRFVDAELTREARFAALLPPNDRPRSIDPTVVRPWLKEHQDVLAKADEAQFKDAARWQPLFRSEPGQLSIAHGLRQRLMELPERLPELASIGVDDAVEQTVASLDAPRMEELASLVGQVAAATGGWFDWKGSSAKRRLRSWLSSRGIAWSEDGLHRLDTSIRRESERRRLRLEIESIVRVFSIDVDFSDWRTVEAQVRQIPGRLMAAFRVCKAAATFPIAPDRQMPLNGWDLESLVASIHAQRAALEAFDAECASLAALDILRPAMSASWIDAQEQRISSSQWDAVPRGEIADLKVEFARLPEIAAFRARLARCDDLTPRVLAALTPIRESLSSLLSEALPGEVGKQILGHWAIARKEKCESETPVLRGLHADDEEGVRLLSAKLAWVNWLSRAIESCPESRRLRGELTGGSLDAVQRLFRRLHAGLDRSRAVGASSAALADLRGHIDHAWSGACERAIRENGSNDVRLVPLRDALPGLRDYMKFREMSSRWIPEVLQAFSILASERAALEEVPPSERAAEIGRTIRLAYWKRRQSLAEQSAPVLRRLEASSVDSWALALDRLDSARRLADIVDLCPTPQPLVLAIESGSSAEVRSALQEFEFRLRRQAAVRRSLECLEELGDWMNEDWIDESRRRVETWRSNSERLSDLASAIPTFGAYQLYRIRGARLTSVQRQVFPALARIRPVLEETARTAPDELAPLVGRLIRREALLAWKQRLERSHPSLLDNQSSLNGKVRELRELDERARASNRERLGEVPLAQDVGTSEDWEDLTRLRGPRARSLRQFFERGRERGLLSLRPVWMMTPDVSSQLLPLEKGIFDLVIFDEASQMPVEYAIPCLYRARTVLVSGDDKQMPPSKFFSGQLENDEAEWTDEEPLDDSASQQERSLQEQAWNRREVKDCPDLLHLGMAALPKTTLQIHYRSEYRELIAYSNAAFYRNELGVPVRHPDETVRTGRPIEYVAVNGIYGDQKNPDEARKVVDILAELWSGSESTVPSTGVVTFNLRQADLIEELLEERAEADEEFRAAYRRELERIDDGEDMSFFVKNVENVQGDERDYIIFSTTFGRTKAGAFRRNFGALGQAGGERRLNVAVTRARRKIIIAGSMPVAEISDMLRTRRRPEVPRDYLQAYLHYAELVSAGRLEESRSLVHRLAGDAPGAETGPENLDGFQQSVAGYLRELGYDPIPTGNDPILGVDFSIRNPSTGLYGVGIECDPPTHRLVRKARSREIWRHSILARSYPALCQVSAYAWYHDPDGERRRLRESVEKAIASTNGES